MNQRSPYYSLFHPKPLAKRISSFGFPKDLGDRYQIVQKWLSFASDGEPSNLLAARKEQSLSPNQSMKPLNG